MRHLSTPKRILITGASRGIGLLAAQKLARAGHHVILAARHGDALNAAAHALVQEGHAATPLVMDVSDDRSVARGIRELLAQGPCDVVVNNAGSCTQREFLHQDPAVTRAEMELNYGGAVRVTRALLPSFVERRAGVVVNVSSLLGSIASPTTASYCASKAALEAWSFALRAELARFHIAVSVFVSPHTDTDMGRAVRFDGVYSLPVDYTARELVRAIDRAPRKYVASPVYRWLLRLGRWFPSFMEAQVGAGTRKLWLPPPSASA